MSCPCAVVPESLFCASPPEPEEAAGDTPPEYWAAASLTLFRSLELIAACIAATVWGWYYGVILLTPALSALAASFLLEPVLRKYTPAPAEGEETPWYLL